MKFTIAVCFAVSAACAPAVSRPALRAGPLIDRFNTAACIHPTQAQPAWDQQITLSDGNRVRIEGSRGFGPRVDVHYERGKRAHTAAAMGDYFRLTDIRIDPATDRLFIRIDGCPPAFGSCGTTIFEYGLNQRRRSNRVRVDAAVLAEECATRPR
jgi:hypothetical protein